MNGQTHGLPAGAEIESRPLCVELASSDDKFRTHERSLSRHGTSGYYVQITIQNLQRWILLSRFRRKRHLEETPSVWEDTSGNSDSFDAGGLDADVRTQRHDTYRRCVPQDNCRQISVDLGAPPSRLEVKHFPSDHPTQKIGCLPQASLSGSKSGPAASVPISNKYVPCVRIIK